MSKLIKDLQKELDDLAAKKIVESAPEVRMRYLCVKLHQRMQVYLQGAGAGAVEIERYTDFVWEEFAKGLKNLGPWQREKGKRGRASRVRVR